MGLVPENQLRTGLPAGGSRIRTIGLRVMYAFGIGSGRFTRASEKVGVNENDGTKRSRGTDGSNPVPSSRQSVSLRNSPPLVRKLPFSAGVRAGAGGAVGRDAQRPANIRSTDGIISGGPYSSTAMPPDVVRNRAGSGPHARSGCLVA